LTVSDAYMVFGSAFVAISATVALLLPRFGRVSAAERNERARESERLMYLLDRAGRGHSGRLDSAVSELFDRMSKLEKTRTTDAGPGASNNDVVREIAHNLYPGNPGNRVAVNYGYTDVFSHML